MGLVDQNCGFPGACVVLKLLRYSMVPTSKDVKSITTSYLSQAGRGAGCKAVEGLGEAGGSGGEGGAGGGGIAIRSGG